PPRSVMQRLSYTRCGTRQQTLTHGGGRPERYNQSDQERPGTAMLATPCRRFFAAAPMGRREFLRTGSLGLLSLGLPQLVQAHNSPPALPCPAAKPRRASCCSCGAVRLTRTPGI